MYWIYSNQILFYPIRANDTSVIGVRTQLLEITTDVADVVVNTLDATTITSGKATMNGNTTNVRGQYRLARIWGKSITLCIQNQQQSVYGKHHFHTILMEYLYWQEKTYYYKAWDYIMVLYIMETQRVLLC